MKDIMGGLITLIYNLIRVSLFALALGIVFKGGNQILAALDNYGVHEDLTSVMDIRNTYNEIMDAKKAEDIISLDIDDVINTFNSNPLQAKEGYEGKMMELSGKVLKIGYAETEAYLILIGSSFHEGDIVQCTFKEGQYKTLAKLNKGDKVVVTGKAWVDTDRFCLEESKIDFQDPLQ